MSRADWPSFYVCRTLIGGAPDCNRRRIYRTSDDMVVWELHPGLGGWSDQAKCDEALHQFRDAENVRLLAERLK